MNFLVKYVLVVYSSMFLFINGEISVIEVVRGSIGFTDYNPGKARPTINAQTQNKLNRILTVRIVAEKGSLTDHFSESMPIQLMDENYTLLMVGKTQMGKVEFDLNRLDEVPQKLIVVSPSTANEIKINSSVGYAEFSVDTDFELPFYLATR